MLLDRIEDAPGKIGTVMLVNAAAGLLVPLAVGFWSDRRAARGGSRRLPFVLGGSLVAAGGLAAVALGFSSSYFVLAAFGGSRLRGPERRHDGPSGARPRVVRRRVTASGDERPRDCPARSAGCSAFSSAAGLTAVAPVGAVRRSPPSRVPALALPTVSRTQEPAPSRRVSETTSRPLAYYLSALQAPRRLQLPLRPGSLGSRICGPARVLPSLCGGRPRSRGSGRFALPRRLRRLRPAAAVLAAGRVRNPVTTAAAAPARDHAHGRRLPRSSRSWRTSLLGRGRARPRRGRLRPHLHRRLPALHLTHPGRRGRRLHRALLLGPRDLVDDRLADRRLADRRDGKLPLALRPRRPRDARRPRAPLARTLLAASKSRPRAATRAALARGLGRRTRAACAPHARPSVVSSTPTPLATSSTRSSSGS